jgi:hypothetical protein
MLLLGVGMNAALARWGGRLGLGDRTDPAALPVAIPRGITYIGG